MKEIRLYCEGGGDGRITKEKLRAGFSEFFREVRDLARKKSIGFTVITCGSRRDAFEKFKTARQTYTLAFNVLLVDAEEPVAKEPWQHLHDRDKWQLQSYDNEHCHLMVQTMEAWIIADLAALQNYYGQGFNAKAIPKNPNVEQISKAELNRALANATRLSRTKKIPYHKTQHAPEILKRISPAKVRQASRHCQRLFDTLNAQLN